MATDELNCPMIIICDQPLSLSLSSPTERNDVSNEYVTRVAIPPRL